MKACRNCHLTLFLLLLPAALLAQQKADLNGIVKQGIALQDSGKYNEAIAKYDAALKIDSTFQEAYYEKSYALLASGREAEAIPFLETLLKLNPNSGAGFDMLGSIYDDLKQPDKAINYYKQGIKADPNYQRLHFNIAITYYRLGQFADAEASAVEAVKLDPRHAGSQRIYALACSALGKRGPALLGWCSFLLLEPQTQRSANAFDNLKRIVNFGISQKTDKNVNVTVSVGNPANLMMPISVIAATQGKNNLSAVDSIELQLTSLFSVAHGIAVDKDQPSLAQNNADYFEKLGKSGNMPAFARLISLTVYKDENTKWFKEHQKELSDLDAWVRDTPRSF